MEKDDGSNREDIFDDVFSQVKSFGRYQHCVYWFIAAMKIPMAVQFGSMIFSFGTQKFKCDSSNVTCPINKCCNNCTSYSFDQRYVSAVSEWGLICDRAYVTALMQSSFYMGMLCGSIVGGWVADRFGRKKCMFGSLFLVATFSLCSAFVDSPIAVIILRFCGGLGQVSVMLSSFALSIEIVGQTKRTFAGVATSLLYKVGGAIDVTIAYLLPYWRHTVIAGSIPGFLFLPFYLILPESPRWLVTQGRLDEAQTILEKFGGKKDKPVDKQQLRSTLEKVRNAQLAKQKVRQNFHVIDLFKTPRLRRYSLVIGFSWFVVALLFIAMRLYVTRLYGDIFINVLIMTLADIPAILSMWILVARFGRRISFTGLMCLGAVALTSMPFIPKDVPEVRTALAIIGKAVMGCQFTLVGMWTSELFPTVVRNLSLGFANFSARIGAILSPFIVIMAQLHGVSMIVPFYIFGGLGISSALLALLLPETLFANMEQTIEAAEEAQLDYSVPCCGKKGNQKKELKIYGKENKEDEMEETRF